MKKVQIMISLLLCVLLLSGCGSVDRYISSIKKGDYEKANSIFMDKIWGNTGDEMEATAKLSEYVDEIKEKLNEEKISLEEFKEIADTLDHLSMWQSVDYSEVAEIYESKQAFSEAEKAFQDGDYLLAMRKFNAVSEKDTKYSEAMDNKQKCIDRYRSEIITYAQSVADTGDYETAWTILEDAISVISNAGAPCDDLRMKQSEVGIAMQDQADREIIDEANRLAAAGDYHAALDTLYASDSSQIQLAYRNMQKDYINSALDRAQSKFENEQNVEGAIGIIEVAMSELVEDSDILTRAYDFYSEYRTKALADMREISIEGGYTYNSSTSAGKYSQSQYATDNYGNTYQSVVDISPNHGQNVEVTYNISKYDFLTGTIYIPEVCQNGDGYYEFWIEVDGDQFLYSGAISRGSEPIDFNIDISSGFQMTISVSASKEVNTLLDGLDVYIGNCYLSCDFSGKPGFTERI